MLPTDPLPAADGPPRFPMGRVVATPAALAALAVANISPHTLLARHARSDWGDLDEPDRQENNRALRDGARLLSAYALPDGSKVWLLTEGDRSATTLLLPSGAP